MVLELVKGRRLSDAIREEGVLSPVRAVDIACKVLNALSEAHALGLVHRDLKPDNIMLVIGPWGEEQAKVLDFGIAKVRTKEKETLETGTGLLLGTPLYMPPEQAMARGAETRSDLYSLGVVLFEMLCGHPPFTAATVFEVLLAHREKPVPPLPPECQVPPALEAAIARAMAKEPEQRFADAADMAQALAEAVPLNAPGTESLRPGPGSPVAAVALRTPLPLGARQSGPGLLSAKTATPLPHGSKRSGAVSASAALRARQSVAGVPPPPQVDPDLASTHTPLPAEKVPQGPDADTAGTMMKSTPAAAPVFRRSSPPKPAPHPAAEPRLSTAERAVVKGSGGRMMLFGVLGLLALGLGGGTSWYLFGRPAAVAKVPDPDPIAKLVEKPPDKLPDKVAEPVKVPDPVVAEAGPDASVPTKVAAKDPDDADADPKKNPKNPKTVASHGPKTPKPKPDRTDKPDSAPTPNPKKDGTHKVDDHGYQVPEF
jgi:serine/threonine-protein kinase